MAYQNNQRMNVKTPSNVTWNKETKNAYARVTRQGKILRKKYFSEKECGSREAAEKAAHDWIAKQLPNLPPPTSSKRRMTKQNRSGKVNVRLVPKLGRTKDQIFWYWLGAWPANRIGIKFSLLQFGDNDAFVMACLASDLETTDKELIEQRFKRLTSEQHRKILAQKRQSPDK
jgi:hypothetical protein